MDYLLYFIQIILIQYTTAQVFTLGGRNFLNNANCANIPMAGNFATNAGILTNVGQTSQLANIVTPCNNIVGQEYLLSNAIGNIANGNIGLAGSNIGLASSNVGIAGNNIGSANNNVGLAGSNIGLANNNIGLAGSNIGLANNNIGLAGSNIGLSNNNIGLAGSNIGLANNNIGLAGSNIGLANNNIGLANNIGVANVDSEGVVYNNAVPMYANVVKPPRDYGIEFSSSALQVGGSVEVNGRMPFSANVAVNGAVPSQGQGAVNYKCDQLNAEES